MSLRKEENKGFHNPNYYDDNDRIRKAVEKKKFLDSIGERARKKAEKSRMSVKINGVQYESLAQAARLTGMSTKTVQDHARKLRSSGFSKLEFEIAIKQPFVFEKIKDDNGPI